MIFGGWQKERVLFYEKEINWINNVFVPQADSLLLYGGSDMIPGMEKFDYGGMGVFDPSDSLKLLM